MSQTMKKKLKKVANYVPFGISYDSEHEVSESNSLDSEHGICDNESEEEGDLQNAYDNLFLECIKLKKLNKQHLQKLKKLILKMINFLLPQLIHMLFIIL
jgi:hypothetical protein